MSRLTDADTKTLDEWAEEIHKNAVAHGWWEEPRGFAEIVALCHSELSEALEEYRNRRPAVWFACLPTDVFGGCRNMAHCDNPMSKLGCTKNDAKCQYQDKKPEGIAVEMIDCIIRILDWCAAEEIDVDELLRKKHEYNKTRPYRHGGKKI